MSCLPVGFYLKMYMKLISFIFILKNVCTSLKTLWQLVSLRIRFVSTVTKYYIYHRKYMIHIIYIEMCITLKKLPIFMSKQADYSLSQFHFQTDGKQWWAWNRKEQNDLAILLYGSWFIDFLRPANRIILRFLYKHTHIPIYLFR